MEQIYLLDTRALAAGALRASGLNGGVAVKSTETGPSLRPIEYLHRIHHVRMQRRILSAAFLDEVDFTLRRRQQKEMRKINKPDNPANRRNLEKGEHNDGQEI